MSAEEEDDSNLDELLLQGDDFVSEEQRQEQAARERRLARKRRLQQAASSLVQEEAQQQNAKPAQRIKQMPTTTVPIKKEEAEPKQISSANTYIKENDNDKVEDDGDDEDDFDMFSSSVSPLGNDDDEHMFAKKTKRTAANVSTSNNAQGGQKVDQQQDWDDDEGYYRATIGEIITIDIPDSDETTAKNDQASNSLRFRVSGVIGKGVFSTVLKCVSVRDDSATATNPLAARLPPEVALKCIRHNETMAKAAFDEIRFLQRFTNRRNTKHGKSNSGYDQSENKDNGDNKSSETPGVVPLLLPHNKVPLEFRGHTVLVFPHMEYNLRDVLQKFGKGVGLSLTAVRSYFGQLLSAATHLKQQSLIHADIKLDNILVSQDFTTVKICDFGSAIQGSSNDSGESAEPIVTPYLVSRFYRAPEIILGLVPTYAVDLWSLAVTAAELFLGNVLFQGKTNNDMLHKIMQQMGPFSNKIIRQHLVQTKRFPIRAHFQQVAAQYVFRQETVDPVSGQVVNKNVSLVTGGSGGGGYSPPQLQSKLLRAKSAKDSRALVLQFCDLLQKCLALDPTRRIAVKMALHHDFFKQQQEKTPE